MVLPFIQPAAGSRWGGLAALCIYILLPLSTVCAGGTRQEQPNPLPSMEISAETAALDPSLPPSPAGQSGESRGESVMRALAEAYPERIAGVEFIDGDWTVEVYNERFYFAGGRLLPASLLDNTDEYTSQPFYNYPRELPPWVAPTPEESARMREQEKLRGTRQQQRRKRSSQFYDTLWRAHNRGEAWDRVKQIRFLGHPILVHYSVLEELSLVEAEILEVSETNAAVRQWMNSLRSVESWNWRDIAASQNRSYHAYGAAIDLLPRSMNGLETYWLWTRQNNGEWWNVPYTRRFHPPEEVIHAFESFGFIWGGKWRYYDTMHFEYRPEILVLSGIARQNLRDLK